MKSDIGKFSEYAAVRKAIQERRSIRRYRPDLPDRGLLLQLIEAAHYAPSSTNFQPWMFLVISNREIIETMRQAVVQKIDGWNPRLAGAEGVVGESFGDFGKKYFLFFGEAPVIIAVCCKPYPISPLFGDSPEKEASHARAVKSRILSIESASAAIQNMLLAAHSLGLGACWMDGPLIAKGEIESLLRVDEPWEIIGLVSVGYPAESPPPVKRKDIQFISRFLD